MTASRTVLAAVAATTITIALTTHVWLGWLLNLWEATR